MEERRARALTESDIEALIAALQGGMTPHEHAEHHHVFQTWIERENRKAEFREKVRAQVGGWGIITLLSVIGYAAWEGARALLRVKGGG